MYKLTYPVALTNKAWQAQKGVLKATSTGIGETLEELERVFKRSPFDDGVEVDDLVVVDPAKTYDTLKKLGEDLERPGKVVAQAINTTRKKILEVERTVKGKSTLKKAATHLQTMREALDTLEEQVRGFTAVICDKAGDAMLLAEKLSLSAERLEELGIEADNLGGRFHLLRSEVKSATTPHDLWIAMTIRSINTDILEMTQLWDLAIKDYEYLLEQIKSPVGGEGVAFKRFEKLKVMYSLGHQTNDFFQRSLINDLLQANQGPNKTVLEAVQNVAQLYVAELDEAEVLIGEMVEVFDAVGKARRKVALLRDQGS